jgi:hypothetical protein
MPHDQSLHELAAEFFRVFARTEYALKASGFNKGDGPAEANWGQFARSVEAFIGNPPQHVREAVEFIMNEPPKKQFIENGLIQWREVAPSTNSNADALFQYVCRIRNNLFHGGKFNGRWFEAARSERLLKAGLTVLQAVVEVEPRVREAYHG